jgi:DNA-binding transcriptional regulator YiaG
LAQEGEATSFQGTSPFKFMAAKSQKNAMSPVRIRRIRQELALSQGEFGRIVGTFWTTIHRWESGRTAPKGFHLQLLVLLEKSIQDDSFRAVLLDSRARDPMFILYRLLEPLYGGKSP